MIYEAGELYPESLEHNVDKAGLSESASCKVTGSSASSICPAALWRALPRIFFSGRNSFSSFARSQTFIKPTSTSYGFTSSSSPLWPMRLPYPGAFKSGWSDTAYDSEENALQKAVNLAVLLLNWLALGRPKHAPPELSLLPLATGAQRAVVRRLESMMREVVLHPVVAAEDMGRVAAKVEDLESLIASLTLRGDAVAARSRGYSAGGRKEPLLDPIEVEFAGAAGRNAGATTPAKPIVASRFKFGSPPSFCPQRFEHPFNYAIAEEALTEDPPKARVLAQHPEKLALFRKLDEGGRLRWFRLP